MNSSVRGGLPSITGAAVVSITNVVSTLVYCAELVGSTVVVGSSVVGSTVVVGSSVVGSTVVVGASVVVVAVVVVSGTALCSGIPKPCTCIAFNTDQISCGVCGLYL